jgi:IS30 family transposase
VARKISWESRAEAYRMLARGRSAKAIGEGLGVDMSTVKVWGNLAGMNFTMGPAGGVEPMPMDVEVPQHGERSYRRLTLQDRVIIQTIRETDPSVSIRQIARRLGVNASTVSREFREHQIRHWRDREYDAELAHYRALSRRPRARLQKLENPALRAGVVSRLNEKFSPEQIAGELKLMFPDDPEMQVSHETIYQALYLQGRGALRHELTVEKALRSGRTARKPQSKLPARSTRPWLEGARLTDRPAEAADRAVPGHWEGDLVVGPENSGIVTLVERRSRCTLLGRLPGARDSETVTEVLQAMIAELPAALKQTITWDQGTEMAAHATFTVKSGCPVFFCDPHSPWQRPSNENTNGLIRDFYPKGTNFNDITDDDLTETQRLLNIRPRKIHGFRSPAAMMDEIVNGVALAT